MRKAKKQLADRFRVLALVYDAVHAPHAVPRLRAAGTVYVPALAAAGSDGGQKVEHLQVTYRAPGGDGLRTVHVDLQLRVAVLAP